MNAEDLKHPSDCWDDADDLPPAPADEAARVYIRINQRMAEEFPDAYTKLRLPSAAQDDS